MQAMAETDRTPRPNWSPSQFVLVPENRSAVLAVRHLARRLTRSPFIPLTLYGPPGTGKSHLADDLHAWAAPHSDVVRIEAADLSAAEASDARRCGLLIVEDLQHLPERAANEFANVLDRRIARRRATLLTGSQAPADMTNVPARIVSRITGGLVVRIDALGVASRRKFLRHRAAVRGMNMLPDALAWLARNTPGSARQLLAALDELRNLSATLPTPPDATAVREHFRETSELRRPTLERITERVGRKYQIAPKLIRGRNRQPGILWPRQLSMYLARELTDLSLAQIGKYFGRDHSTVRHACQKIEETIATDTALVSQLRELRSELS
jgi:chromosomal replication initiator protein